MTPSVQERDGDVDHNIEQCCASRGAYRDCIRLKSHASRCEHTEDSLASNMALRLLKANLQASVNLAQS